MEVVLRLLCGEEVAEVSREVQVPAPQFEAWRWVFLERGLSAPKLRSGEWLEREPEQTSASLGDRAALPGHGSTPA